MGLAALARQKGKRFGALAQPLGEPMRSDAASFMKDDFTDLYLGVAMDRLFPSPGVTPNIYAYSYWDLWNDYCKQHSINVLMGVLFHREPGWFDNLSRSAMEHEIDRQIDIYGQHLDENPHITDVLLWNEQQTARDEGFRQNTPYQRRFGPNGEGLVYAAKRAELIWPSRVNRCFSDFSTEGWADWTERKFNTAFDLAQRCEGAINKYFDQCHATTEICGTDSEYVNSDGTPDLVGQLARTKDRIDRMQFGEHTERLAATGVEHACLEFDVFTARQEISAFAHEYYLKTQVLPYMKDVRSWELYIQTSWHRSHIGIANSQGNLRSFNSDTNQSVKLESWHGVERALSALPDVNDPGGGNGGNGGMSDVSEQLQQWMDEKDAQIAALQAGGGGGDNSELVARLAVAEDAIEQMRQGHAVALGQQPFSGPVASRLPANPGLAGASQLQTSPVNDPRDIHGHRRPPV